MSRFSEREVQAYREVFEQFAGVNGCMGKEGFALALPLFGPAPSAAKVTKLFESESRDGTIDLDGFLEILAGYESEARKLTDQGRRAISHFAKKTGQGGLTRDAMREILMAGPRGLSAADAESAIDGLFHPTDPHGAGRINEGNPAVSAADLAWVDKRPPPKVVEPLYRDIRIEVGGILDLAPLAVTKARAGGVTLNALDPYVTVQLGRTRHDTTVALNTSSPRWERAINLRVTFPSNKFSLVQEYIESEIVLFHVWDYDTSGTSPQSLWVGTAQVPLRTALRATRQPLRAAVPLHTRHARFGPNSNKNGSGADDKPLILHVSMHAPAASGIVDEFRDAESTWQHRFQAKWASDMTTFGLSGTGGTAPKEVEIPHDVETDNFGEYLSERIDEIRHAHARRPLLATVPDEHNVFRFASSMLAPLSSGLPSSADAVAAVARIPGRLAGVPLRGPVPRSAQLSPGSLIAFQGFCQRRDRAFLLCSLLLGDGLSAYVAVGTVRNAYTVGTVGHWVAVLDDGGAGAVPGLHCSLSTADLTGLGTGTRLIDPVSGVTYTPGDINNNNNNNSSSSSTTSGTTNSGGGGCPMTRVGCLVGYANVYVNTQRDDRVGRFTWSLGSWEPLLSEGAIKVFGPIGHAASQLPLPPRGPTPRIVESMSMIRALGAAINSYRGNTVWAWHSPASRAMQRVLKDMATKPTSAGSQPWDEQKDLDAIGEACDKASTEVLPAGSIKVLRVYPLDTTSVEIVLRQLVWTGILDCSVPRCVYFIAAVYGQRPWNMSSSLVAVGYAYPLAAADPEDLRID